MSSKYKVGESAIPHFVTFTVVGWKDVFSRERYKELFTESLKYCIEHKGFLPPWVLAECFRRLVSDKRHRIRLKTKHQKHGMYEMPITHSPI